MVVSGPAYRLFVVLTNTNAPTADRLNMILTTKDSFFRGPKGASIHARHTGEEAVYEGVIKGILDVCQPTSGLRRPGLSRMLNTV